MKRTLRTRVVALLLPLLLAGCGSSNLLNFGANTPPTIYDLTQRPQEFAGKQVTAQGYYLWKPGDPAQSVLLPGVNTVDGVRDAQPIYASVQCDAAGACKPSTTEVGTPDTGAVWLENFPAEATADLHQPGDAVWGVVEVTGTFETGSFGPDGAYKYRMNVTGAKALQKVERVVSAVENKPLGDGKTTIFDLNGTPDQFNGQTVTSQGFYFWSPSTNGTFVERVEREKADNGEELAPKPGGVIMGLDGFPAEESGKLNVGPNGSFVWGLVEVTGTFETGSFGAYDKQIKVQSVKVLEAAP